MFETNIISEISRIIRTNQVNVTQFNDCTYCYYQFGQEQVGVILIKQNGVIHGYRTCMLPNNEIFDAVIEHCKDHIDNLW